MGQESSSGMSSASGKRSNNLKELSVEKENMATDLLMMAMRG